ncbi:MAG: hypothetical protein QM658_03150 [Gordonia sp. (in: high G+C Gram-positive bacteria)]
MIEPMVATSNERLWDDSAFTPLGERTPEPQSVGVLFSQLGVRYADSSTRLDALRSWLTGHTPSEKLARSIVRRGYGDLLRRAS